MFENVRADIQRYVKTDDVHSFGGMEAEAELERKCAQVWGEDRARVE